MKEDIWPSLHPSAFILHPCLLWQQAAARRHLNKALAEGLLRPRSRRKLLNL
ncbi:MAG TPA: hypothetical protein VF240_02675 [Pyrinomonadaceae bacterium]